MTETEESQAIKRNVAKEAKAYWGGKRRGAGRKRLTEEVLSKSMRVSEREVRAVHLMRELKLEVSALDLKFLAFAKGRKLNLRTLMQKA